MSHADDQATSIAQDDLGRILAALGLGDHARPASPHDVVVAEVLPAIDRLRGRIERWGLCYVREIHRSALELLGLIK